MRAYPEIYLPRAKAALGDAFDYAVNCCGIPGAVFAKLFAASPVSERMERGDPAYVTGCSGIDIVTDVVWGTTGSEPQAVPGARQGPSPEHWIGWSVAHYQWHSCRPYDEVLAAVGYEGLLRMYPTLHEADTAKFIETVDAIVRSRNPQTRLRRLRTACGYTQAELGKRAEVSLRSIQMYEQRNKDINKAAAETVWRLARVLGCSMESLLER